MAAGKNYLNYAGQNGVPAAINVYYLTGADLSVTPLVGSSFAFSMPVHKDGSGHFILCPLDPASITGLAALVQ